MKARMFRQLESLSAAGVLDIPSLPYTVRCDVLEQIGACSPIRLCRHLEAVSRGLLVSGMAGRMTLNISLDNKSGVWSCCTSA